MATETVADPGRNGAATAPEPAPTEAEARDRAFMEGYVALCRAHGRHLVGVPRPVPTHGGWLLGVALELAPLDPPAPGLGR
jgi:hypothetical protein